MCVRESCMIVYMYIYNMSVCVCVCVYTGMSMCVVRVCIMYRSFLLGKGRPLREDSVSSSDIK